MAKRRITYKLDDNQVAIVGTIETWRHLAMVYENLASQAETAQDASRWTQHGAWIRSWINSASKDLKEWE